MLTNQLSSPGTLTKYNDIIHVKAMIEHHKLLSIYTTFWLSFWCMDEPQHSAQWKSGHTKGMYG